ncbi:hypothetical protein GCM10008955_10950 [Deinococcus malanensis]|uniref:P pilus assembly protein, chaperone PapD n=1 Tax=Deinococcus malanensis TaxID=1706855 RepID=A0ABQ2ES04_9DEIO|nr:hypothetical protein [Deinococcus malanensis]GGK19334.1 hypothetical protein GCM10008955_10950 [Deinococcus malanensis]
MHTTRSHFVALALLTVVGVGQAQVQVASAPVTQYDVKPGRNVIEGILTLTNPGSKDEQAHLVLSDVKSDPQAGAVYLKPGTLNRSNTSWLELPSSVVTVPAHGKLNVPYRINIPANAAAGTHWGVILVQGGTVEKTAASAGKSSITIREMTQYAVQVFVNLPGGQAKLKFQNPNLSKTSEGLKLDVELGNQGERLALPNTRVEVYDSNGTVVLKLNGRQRRVLPGMSVLETHAINGLKPGKYQVLILADDESGVVGARYNVTVE